MRSVNAKKRRGRQQGVRVEGFSFVLNRPWSGRRAHNVRRAGAGQRLLQARVRVVAGRVEGGGGEANKWDRDVSR